MGCLLSGTLALNGPHARVELPHSLTHLSQLKHLHLQSFRFQGSLAALAGLPALSSLAVVFVKVSAGQNGLSALTQLAKLSITHSTFSCEAAHLAALTRLVSLNLEDMSLADFEVPSGLRRLRKLKLDKNRLTAVPLSPV